MMNNLRNALNLRHISVKSYAEFLGVSEKTARNKLNGETEFSFPEAEKTRRILFPEYDMMYLFAKDTTKRALRTTTKAG